MDCKSKMAALVLIGAISGCGGSNSSSTSGGSPTPTGGSSVPSSHHVVMVMEENQAYASVVGATAVWPNLNKLMTQGAAPANYYADAHPSIGNYFMLTTGQTLTGNDSSKTVWNVDNLARQMISAGVSFRVYAEGITQGYVGGDTGQYLIRHNPFAMLSDVAATPQTASKYIWPFSQFASDAANNALTQFSFIVPNIMHDAHTGTPLAADAWLQAQVAGPVSATTAFKSGGDGILIVDFDESVNSDTTNGGGHVAVVFWGPMVKAGYKQTSTTVYQHQSMLATVAAALNLSGRPGAASSAPLMSEFFIQK
ncbi:MAG TPA: alkaline phosphatase family protein [Terracidiphilus sp.]